MAVRSVNEMADEAKSEIDNLSPEEALRRVEKKIRYYDVFSVIYWIIFTRIKKIFL